MPRRGAGRRTKEQATRARQRRRRRRRRRAGREVELRVALHVARREQLDDALEEAAARDALALAHAARLRAGRRRAHAHLTQEQAQRVRQEHAAEAVQLDEPAQRRPQTTLRTYTITYTVYHYFDHFDHCMWFYLTCTEIVK